MDPNQPGAGNYPGNRPFDPAQGRPTGGAQPRPSQGPPAYPSGPGSYPPGYGQGAQPYGRQAMHPQYPYAQTKPFSTKAIVAMVMGGISVTCLPAPITGLIGGILGYLGMRESREPGGTHRGWGLALAGLIVSGLFFLISVAYYGFVVYMVVVMEESQQEYRIDQSERDARADLELIKERMQLYAIENGNSLQAGGPVVRDGWVSSYGEGAEKVQGRLQLKDLVYGTELERPISEYSIEVTGRSTATVRNSTTGTTLTITDIAKDKYRIDQGSTR